MKKDQTQQRLIKEIEELRIRLQEAEDIVQAIRQGAVDAIVVSGPAGEQVFTLTGGEHIYRRLVETMSEAGLTTTLEGRILFCNERFAEMVGRPMEQIIGRPLEEFVVESARRNLAALLIITQAKPSRMRLVFAASDGMPVPASVAASILQDGDSTSICIVAADLTELEDSEGMVEQVEEEKKAVEEHAAASRDSRRAALNIMEDAMAARQEAEKLSAELQREISERKAVEQERQRLLELLEDKNKELQSIVYVASHDLRSPLLNVYGFSGQLEEQCGILRKIMEESQDIAEAREKTKGIFETDIPENVNFIKAGAQKMQMLINGLLTMSRLGSVPLNITTVDMNKTMAEITKAMAYQVKDKGVQVQVDELPPCKGDPTQINQLFSNIVNNALKYLDPNRKGQIHISGRTEGDRSVYSVSDNGIGIPPEHKNRIFEIFHRLNPRDDIGGEGLGLSIVLRIVDRHSGRIWVDSTPDKGSTFHVALPSAWLGGCRQNQGFAYAIIGEPPLLTRGHRIW